VPHTEDFFGRQPPLLTIRRKPLIPRRIGPVERIRELVGEGRRRLATVAESPGREARLLLAHVLGYAAGEGESALLARDEETVSAADRARYRDFLERRQRGEPVAYLFGRKEFYGRDFAVDDRVLIPRPETEALVEIALALDLPANARVLDLGTGSGAIALTIAAERPSFEVVATDLSLGALDCARRNRRRHGLERRVALARMDLASALAVAPFDLVVSNPPYVDPEEPELVAPDVRTYEPHLALFAAERGFAVIARLLALARDLVPGAFLAFEIGFGQRDAVLALAAGSAGLELFAVRDDSAGIPRDVVFKRTGVRAAAAANAAR
jgi:release factor glutamine methyltransferase